MPGDLYVVGIVPVYDKADPFGCGAIRNIGEYKPGIRLEFSHEDHEFPVIPSLCPNPMACSHCNHIVPVTTSVPIVSSKGGVVIGLGVAVSILILVVVIAIVIIIILKRNTPTGEIKQGPCPANYEQRFLDGSKPPRSKSITKQRDLRRGNKNSLVSIRGNSNNISQPGITITTLQYGAAEYNTQNDDVNLSHVPQAFPRQFNTNGPDMKAPRRPPNPVSRPRLQVINSTYHTICDGNMPDNTMEIGQMINAESGRTYATRQETHSDHEAEDGQNQIVSDPYIHPIP